MILRSESTLTVFSFNELYVYAYNLLRKTGGHRKTVILGEMNQKNGIPEGGKNIDNIFERKLGTLSKEGWVVLDILSFQPFIKGLLALQKMSKYPYPYLHDFSIPLIMSGIFETVHFAENYFESFDATHEYLAAKEINVPIMYL